MTGSMSRSEKIVSIIVIIAVAIVIALAVLPARAEDRPATATPKLTDAQKLTIRNAQLDLTQVQLQMTQLEQQYRQLSAQREEKAKVLNTAIEDAFKAHKIKQADWTLDANLELFKAKREDPKREVPQK